MSNQDQPNRRTALRSGAAVSASLLAAAAAPRGVYAAGQSEDPNRVIRLALIGCGGRGTGAINDSLTINDNVKLVAMADVDLQKCKNTAAGMSQQHGDKVDVGEDKMHAGLEAYKKVLEDPDVDVVLIASPPGFHPLHTLEAVKAGKHVFVEKPSCVDHAGYETCLEAHDKAVENGTAIVTGTQYRRQTNYVGAIEKIREGMIGDIVSATSRYCSNGIWFKNRKEGMSDVQYQIYNWMHFTWLAGDQICEQAVHNIDVMNWVMGGAPETAYGGGGRFTRPEGSEMWDSMAIDYVYPGNRVLSFMCRQIPGTKTDNGNVIYGTKGIATIHAGSGGSTITDRDGKEIWSMKGSIAAAYKQEHKDLIDSIRSGKPIVELRETAESSLTAAMGRLAAYTGQRVTWDFVSKESNLDLFPKNLKWEGSLPEPSYAIPGKTKLT
ncbi:Gfo/Idh/MocA family protein [Roseimaritima sediminicola]|uniref:Gfo/Idh/MocA family protein n=1 Tax=Roseimaritima sediminicola TaxID=2662066 RepID=UPI0012982573|nr:Gfo/Idh/MocA family oxidoreductase [Roseimaritima sediminicola]